MKSLLDAGASIFLADAKRRTAIHYAAIAEGVEPLQLLITRLKDSASSTPKGGQSRDLAQTLNLMDVEGITPLFLAAERKRVEIIRLLIQNGADGSFSLKCLFPFTENFLPFTEFPQHILPSSYFQPVWLIGLALPPPSSPAPSRTCRPSRPS